MKNKMIYFLLIFFAGFLLGCDQKPNNSSISNEASTKEAAFREKENVENNSISQVQLYDLDGEAISWSQFAGKTIFLNFWATWCRPCLKEMPSIERAREQLVSEDFVFLAASDEDLEKIKKFKESHDYSFQFLHLKSKFPDVGIYSLPTTFIIDSTGEVAMKKAGALEWDQPDIIEKLKDIAGDN